MKTRNNILIDCRFMNHKNFGGIEIYTLELIRYLSRQNLDISILLSKNDSKGFFDPNWKLNFSQWPSQMSLKEKLGQPALYKELDCDIFYSPVWYPGFLGYKTFERVVTTIHDCIPLAYYPNKKIKYNYYAFAFLGTLLSDTIITDSFFSEKEIKKYFPFTSRKIRSLSVPLPREKLSTNDESILYNNKLSTKGYFLFVSALRPYKGFDLSISAISLLKDRGIPLVIVGDPVTSYGLTDTKTIRPDTVRFIGHVSDAQLNSLYKNALALVFPSRYEGFGLPIIEAQYHGCPVIATHTASIPEVGGDSVLYVMPDKEEALIASLAEKMALIATDTELRKALVQRGYENIQRFMPEKVLPKIVDAILGNSKP